MWQIWLIASGIFFIIEIFTTGFLIFWLGIAGLCSMVVSFFTSNIFIQTIVFVVVSIILILFTRPLINKFLKIDKKNILPTNVYRLINKEGIVIQNIEPLSNTGKVKVGGELWSAISDTEIAKDTHIKITGVEGVKLKVEPVKQTSNK